MMTDPATAAHLYRTTWLGPNGFGPNGMGAPGAGIKAPDPRGVDPAAEAVQPVGEAGTSFQDTMTELVQEAIGAIDTAEDTAMAGMAGQGDPHAIVEALAAAELALETAVTVRDKAVEAYQEILRMPV